MKLSKSKLTEIIREELQKVLENLPTSSGETNFPGPDYDDEEELPPLEIPRPE
jgi:hypothetical protein